MRNWTRLILISSNGVLLSFIKLQYQLGDERNDDSSRTVERERAIDFKSVLQL